ncbi:MAG: hypothetical protein WC655_01780 [Candidatus Hydrogenedentales bacterium]|jgi:hypothetical protein
MSNMTPKSVRRRLLTILYEHYLKDPLEMLTPEDVLEDGTIPREDLLANIHYLGDKAFVELMIGYNPPWFAAARITANGIDLVENRYEFNLRFPPQPDELESALADVPVLMEQLLQEAEFAPLDGDERKCLLRDILFLRDEVSRPETRWRTRVIETVLKWAEAYFEEPAEHLPSLEPLRQAIARELGQ